MDDSPLSNLPSQRIQPTHDHELCESCAGLLAELDALYEAITEIESVVVELAQENTKFRAELELATGADT